MKRTLLYVGAALAMAISFAGCNKEAELIDNNVDVKEGIPFSLIANPVETRTVNDGMDTKWKANDGINVFHAVAGTQAYVNDGKYTISEANLEINKFEGTLGGALVEGTSYDWYMFYPYTSQIVTPANNSKGFATIGSSATGSQTQNGNSNKAHLAGDGVPLWGKITGVTSTQMPNVQVNHACSFIEFNVTNNSGVDLTVHEINFTGTEAIVGTYYINYAGDVVAYTGSGDEYVSNVAKLNVQNPTAISAGETASFYMVIKPFTASTGALKVSVNDYEKTIPISKAITFTAGKIKKINFNYDQEEAPTTEATFIFNTSAGLSELGIAEPSSGGTSLDGKTCVKEGISLSFAQGGATTPPRAWKSNSGVELRTYANNTLTFTAPFGYNVTEIRFGSSSNGSYTASTGTWTGSKWTGEAEIVTLTKGSGSSHSINTITVICSKAGSKILDRIELSGNYKTEFYVNDAFDYSGLVVTAYFTDGTSLVVDSPLVSSPDMTTAAESVPVTVSYTYEDVTKTAQYAINISELPVYVVTLGDTEETLSATMGESVTLPTRSFEGYTFEGWSTTNLTESTTTAPSLISAGSYTPTASITLYPVFSIGDYSTMWVKTDLDDLTAGNYVLLSPGGYAFNGTINSGHGQKTATAIEFNSDGQSASIPSDACVLEFQAVQGGFKLYNSSLGYLYATKAASGGLAWQSSESNYWSKLDEVTLVYSANSAHLRTYNDTFRTYGNNANAGIVLAKESIIGVKSYLSNPQ